VCSSDLKKENLQIDYFVSKPFNATEVLDQVERLIGHAGDKR
jgi:hypothetical protein